MMQRLAPSLVVARLLRRAANRIEASGQRRLAAEVGKAIERLPKDHQAAAAALVSWDVLRSEPFRDTERQGRLLMAVAEADLQLFYERLQKALQARGMAFRLFQVNRTHEEQDRLFGQGVSNARAGQSAHQYGCAFDLIDVKRGWGLSKKEWAIVGALGKEAARKANIKITWGGDFQSIYDPAHWELADWRKRRADYPAKLAGVA